MWTQKELDMIMLFITTFDYKLCNQLILAC
jgi:hypothetical protein